jgi:SAM-dependent MidA family methyltransferase
VRNLASKRRTLNPPSQGCGAAGAQHRISNSDCCIPALDVRLSAFDVLWLNTELVTFIRDIIKTRGPQSFAWFMQQALYHARHGYYSSDRAAIGRRGDYFTNVSVGPLFGQLLAAQFTEIWECLGTSDNFVIVEQGAHHGELARDVLDWTRERIPRFFAALRYQIVEPFPVLQDRQSKTLASFADKLSWRDSVKQLAPFVGLHFSNELLDSMPVHLLVSGKDGWREKYVDIQGDEFVFIERPITDRRLENLPALPVGYQVEINLAALDWIDDLASKLQRGVVIVIDYGFAREEFYAPHRSAGTLQVRTQHRHLRSPFDDIGHADITTHVDWTSFVERAEMNGLRLQGFTDQHHFVTGIVSELFAAPEDSKAKRALQMLLHPEMLGRAFQVLALTKDFDLAAPLAGFRFMRDASAALGV